MKYVSPLNLFRDLLKRKVSERGRFLGLDVGDKYVGLAVSDSNNKIASQLCVLLRKKKNIDLMADDFQSLISKFNLKGFIVGCPFNRKLNENDAVQVKHFIYELCKTGKLEGLEYTYFDESYTSKNVEIFLKPLKLPPEFERKALLDKIAAVEILQDYLDYVNRKVNSKAIEEAIE